MIDDFDELAREFGIDWPGYDQTYFDSHEFQEFLNYFRWVFNAIFVGMPCTIVVSFLLTMNIFSSIELNKIWANGNVFLISKTVYIII